MASTGHTSTQAPQSVHNSASMRYFSSPAVIASTGHSGSQAPQLIHSSLIVWAIFPPFGKVKVYNNFQENSILILKKKKVPGNTFFYFFPEYFLINFNDKTPLFITILGIF
jgi:hypothetical protein